MDNENLSSCQDDNKEESPVIELALTDQIPVADVTDGLKKWYLVVEVSAGKYVVRATEEAMQSGEVGSHIQGVQEGDKILTAEPTTYDDAWDYRDHLEQFYQRTIEEPEQIVDDEPIPSVSAYFRIHVDTLDTVREAAENIKGIELLQRMTTSRLNQIRFGQTYSYENSVYTLLAIQLLSEDLNREIRYVGTGVGEIPEAL